MEMIGDCQGRQRLRLWAILLPYHDEQDITRSCRGDVSMTAPVAVLVKGAMQAMFWTKLTVGALLVAFMATVGVGVGTVLVQHHGAVAMTPVPEEARQPKALEPKASAPAVRDGLEVVVKPTKAVFAEKDPLQISGEPEKRRSRRLLAA
jgi:hypothetical protein